ncbi:MAG: chloramphenicol acetyltransferase [Aureibaculum sp.]
MRELDIETWNRKQQFHFFNQFDDPYFAVTVEFDVTKTYKYSKKNNISFFALYLHACIKAINSVENLKYRIQNGKVMIHDVIHASPTILRDDHTFGFSFIHFDEDFKIFNKNLEAEKNRILNSTEMFPQQNTEDCIYCSAMPWFNFSGHKEPLFGVKKESVPKLAFGKYVKKDDKLMMPVAIAANHALVDGYHVGLFVKKFQKLLDNI